MKITILNSSQEHPVNFWLKKWIDKNKSNNKIQLIRSKKELVEGDILFLISCSELISNNERNKFKKTLVIHASDLPTGKGWSPHIWDIINGNEVITLSLLEADDKVDSGDIWTKIKLNIPSTALFDEINQIIFDAELDLMDFAVKNFNSITPLKQNNKNQTYWPKRTPKDSEIDISKSLDEQFNLIRVCDPERFPAFFFKNGKKFKLKVEVVGDE